MLSSGQLLGFTLASFVLIVVPGPGVLFVVGRALSHGGGRRPRPRPVTLWVLRGGRRVAVGLGAVLERSAQVFIAVELIGALYLVVLACRPSGSGSRWRWDVGGGGASDGWRAVRDGVVVGVTNRRPHSVRRDPPQFVNRRPGTCRARCCCWR